MTRRWMFATFFVAVSVFHICVYAELPIALNPVAGKDDGLYIGLGRAISSGNWLGAYTSTTHAKGPGYPIFLALNSWSGLPIGIGHAIFQIFATSIFSLAIFHVTRRHLVAVATFAVILLNPAMYSADMARILRDVIYPFQTILIIGLVLLAMTPQSRSRAILLALCGGLCLGWFWITREEGIWIIPGLVFLIFVYPLRWGARAQTLLILGLGASSVYVAIGFANQARYGYWQVSELNAGAFPLAMNALQRVEVGQRVAHVPVTREARAQIYRVSPSFAALRDYIERPAMGQISCGHLPHTCGEIAGGWFLWVVRDGAQAAGFFTDPAKSTAFFKTVANEVNAACDRGEFRCRQRLIKSLPNITTDDLRGIPAAMKTALRLALFIQSPRMDAANSVGPERMAMETLAFLNRPNSQPIADAGSIFNDRNSNRSRAFLRIRTSLTSIYGLIIQMAAAFGILSLLVTTAILWTSLPIMGRLAWVMLILATSRIALLSLIEITSFPAMGLHYLGPVCHLLALSTIFALFAFRDSAKLTMERLSRRPIGSS